MLEGQNAQNADTSRNIKEDTPNQDVAKNEDFAKASVSVDGPYPMTDMEPLVTRLSRALIPHGFILGNAGRSLAQSKGTMDSWDSLTFLMSTDGSLAIEVATGGEHGGNPYSIRTKAILRTKCAGEQLRLELGRTDTIELMGRLPLRILVQLPNKDSREETGDMLLVVEDRFKESRLPEQLPYPLISYSDAKDIFRSRPDSYSFFRGHEVIGIDVHPAMIEEYERESARKLNEVAQKAEDPANCGPISRNEVGVSNIDPQVFRSAKAAVKSKTNDTAHKEMILKASKYAGWNGSDWRFFILPLKEREKNPHSLLREQLSADLCESGYMANHLDELQVEELPRLISCCPSYCRSVFFVCEKEFVDERGAMLLEVAAKYRVLLRFISPTDDKANVIGILEAAVAARETGRVLP